MVEYVVKYIIIEKCCGARKVASLSYWETQSEKAIADFLCYPQSYKLKFMLKFFLVVL